MMDNDQLIREVNSLIQLDIDAVHAYEQAIEKVQQASVRTQLDRFCGEHRRHVSELSQEVRALGGTPPEYSRDFKGFLIEGFTSLLSLAGTKGALQAMETNEKLTNRRYGEARQWPVQESLRTILRRNAADEEAHLSYIQNALKLKVWETRQPAAGERPHQTKPR